MNFTKLQSYKHDIVGKFPIIERLVSSFTEKSFGNNENDQAVMAIHESLLKMVFTSKKALENHSLTCKLVISKRLPDLTLKKKNFGRCVFRLEENNSTQTYYYFLQENTLDISFALGTITALCPISEFESDFQDPKLSESFQKVVEL